ncbi:uncharacterized protein ACJ7VT_020495 isoform 2-T2 [Polymixia lowei]
MSLSLTRLNKSDEGLYRCEIWQGWNSILVKNISLKPKDCKTLEPVKAAPNTEATLSCPLNTTSGQHQPQNVFWTVVKGGTENPIFQSPNIIHLRESIEAAEASLVIHSVKPGDSGWYRCKYLVGQSQRCFDMKLLVQDPLNATEIEQAVTTTEDIRTTQEERSAVTSTEDIRTTQEESSAGTSTGALVASLIIGIVIMTLLIVGVVYFYMRHPGIRTLPADDHYEVVHFPASEGFMDQQNNVIYESVQEERICTYQCQ